MLTWWGIMLDVVDTPYRGGVLCLRGGVLCLVWWIRHTEAGCYAYVVVHFAQGFFQGLTSHCSQFHHFIYQYF